MKTFLWGAVVMACSGCYAPPAPTCPARQTAVEARAELREALEFAEQAQESIDASQGLLDATASARAAYVSGRWSDAMADLAIALRMLEEQGRNGPSVETAEVLFRMAGE